MTPIELFERDFSLINHGLDALLKTSPVADIMLDVMSDKFIGNDRNAKDRWEREKKVHRDRETKRLDELTEEVRLLQAKLISLKRQLMEQAAVNKTNELLTYVK